jgi:hypothetical protein
MISNVFDNIEAFSEILDIEDLLEGRFENNGDGNPIYIGYSPFPNADPAEPLWYIRKIVYDGENVIRAQLPDDGIKFAYVWDDRADYFA